MTLSHYKKSIAAAGLIFSAVSTPEAVSHPNHEHGHEHSTPDKDAASVTQAAITGSGTHTYESVPGWCELPGRKALGNTHGGMVVDREGLVYFNTDTKRSIMVYSPDGKFLRSFAEDFVGIHGMTIVVEENEEFIYAAHLHGKRIVKFTLDGEVVWTLDGPPADTDLYDDLNRYNPTAVAVAPNGDFYVADGYGMNYVHHYNKDRHYLGSFGGKGSEPGKFQTCHGIALDTRGKEPLLLVSDRENRRLQHFDLEGNFVAIVATGLRRPCSVSIHGDDVAVAELEGRVTILDYSNHPIAFLGDNPDRKQWAKNPVPSKEWIEGYFTAPHGCTFDKSGNLYVMDWNASGRISKLRRMTFPLLTETGSR